MISYYGPTGWDDDPSHLWHKDCPVGEDGHDGQVYLFDDHAVCSHCGQQVQM